MRIGSITNADSTSLMVYYTIELRCRLNIEYAEISNYGLIGRKMLEGGLWAL
jgi:hypothetical protein